MSEVEHKIKWQGEKYMKSTGLEILHSRPKKNCYSVPSFLFPSACCLSCTGLKCHWHLFISQMLLLLFFNYALQPSKAYCAIWVRCSNFHHQASPRMERRWNCGWEMSGKFCLNADFHVTFRDLLHAVKLRHGNSGFNSHPKEGVLRIFSPYKSDGSAGCEPANLGTKGQHATSRPPKLLSQQLTCTASTLMTCLKENYEFCWCQLWNDKSAIHGSKIM
jgi:hypothetical protein